MTLTGIWKLVLEVRQFRFQCRDLGSCARGKKNYTYSGCDFCLPKAKQLTTVPEISQPWWFLAYWHMGQPVGFWVEALCFIFSVFFRCVLSGSQCSTWFLWGFGPHTTCSKSQFQFVLVWSLQSPANWIFVSKAIGYKCSKCDFQLPTHKIKS